MTHAAEQLTLTLDDKLNLIKSRARLLGFRRHDLEDAVQEVAMIVLEFEYDAEKSNGATETTALITVIDRRLQLLKRSKRRYADLLDRATQHLAADHQGMDDGPCSESSSVEEQFVNAEIEGIISAMDEDAQQVCRLLMQGLPPNTIADQLGMGWQRVVRLVSVIQERLEEAGFSSADAE
jgi:DNA-directed RNA polymerase specialized sigma24 family protein